MLPAHSNVYGLPSISSSILSPTDSGSCIKFIHLPIIAETLFLIIHIPSLKP